MEIRHEPVIVRGRRSRSSVSRSGRACATSLCAISSLQQMICCWLECYVQAHVRPQAVQLAAPVTCDHGVHYLFAPQRRPLWIRSCPGRTGGSAWAGCLEAPCTEYSPGDQQGTALLHQARCHFFSRCSAEGGAALLLRNSDRRKLGRE